MSQLYSEKFKDIYFSVENGQEETLHTFIKANNFEERIKECKQIKVGELGFGSGLNFLTLCNYIDELDSSVAIEYWSVEKYALSKNEIMNGLMVWANLLPLLKILIKEYPDNPQNGSAYKIKVGKHTLNLLLGDINDELDKFPTEIDCWFLDGFSPDKNPDMWSAELFKTCFNKSAPDATATTFTAAGMVKQNLRSAGFFVKRLKGFGKKRHMVKAYRQNP